LKKYTIGGGGATLDVTLCSSRERSGRKERNEKEEPIFIGKNKSEGQN